MKKSCFSNILFFCKKKECSNIQKLYKRKIEFKARNEFKITNYLYKKIEEKNPVFYISESNYLLQKDILDFSNDKKNIQIFNEKEKNLELETKEEELIKKEKSYLLRSYITSINYEFLYRIDLYRIEQFLLLLYSKTLSYYFYNGLLFSKHKNYNLYINEKKINFNSFYKNKLLKNNTYSTLDFVLYVSKIKNINPLEVLKKLNNEFNYFLNITDPFIGTFEVLNLNKFFFKKEIELIRQTASKIPYFLQAKDENKKSYYLLDYSMSNIFSKEELSAIKNYFLIYITNQKEQTSKTINILENKLIKSNIYSLYFLSYYNKFFFPIEDFFKTLIRLLHKDYLIINKNGEIYPHKKLVPFLMLEKNTYYLSINELIKEFNEFASIEKEIFELPFFPLINTKKPSFSCPICKNKKYILDYDYLKCKDKNCYFLFNRKNLKSLGIKTVLLKDIIKGLSFPSIYIENNNKQKKLFTLKEYAPYRYSFTLKS